MLCHINVLTTHVLWVKVMEWVFKMYHIFRKSSWSNFTRAQRKMDAATAMVAHPCQYVEINHSVKHTKLKYQTSQCVIQFILEWIKNDQDSGWSQYKINFRVSEINLKKISQMFSQVEIKWVDLMSPNCEKLCWTENPWFKMCRSHE